MAGAQRWLLHCRAAKSPEEFAADSALVALGSRFYLAERSGAADHCLLPGRADGHTDTRRYFDEYRRRSDTPRSRVDHLRCVMDIAVGQERTRWQRCVFRFVRSRRLCPHTYDERPCRVHSRWGFAWNLHERERLASHPSFSASNGCGVQERNSARYVPWG